MGTTKLLRGSGQVLPRARPRRTAVEPPFPSSALAVSPQLTGRFPSPAFLDRVSFRRSAGFLATSPIYFFFFFAAFLAFLFFAITSLHQKLRSKARRPSQVQRAIHRRDEARQRILFVARWPPSDSKNLFSRQETCVVRKIRNVIGKNFQQHCTYQESSKNYFAAKRLQTGRSVEIKMHSIAIIARNRVGFDISASLRRRVRRSR